MRRAPMLKPTSSPCSRKRRTWRHAPGSDVEADKQPLFAEAAHLALALAEQLADLRKIEDRIAFELAPVILHEVYDLEDLFDRPQNAGQIIRVLIFHLCRVWFPRQK